MTHDPPTIPTTVWRNATAIYGLALVVGATAGAAAILFEYLSQFVSWAVLQNLVGFAPEGPKGEPELFEHVGGRALLLVGLLLAPMIGGLVSGLLCSWFAPEASGHGTDAVIDAYHNKGGRIRARVPLLKAITTAISLGTGGSGGREGPIAQIGAGFGSFLGQMLNLTSRQRRVLLAAGMGAGVGAIFRAPLAGALFAAEILYRESEFESDVVIPSVLASSLAYCVYCEYFGEFGHLFQLEDGFVFRNVLELGPYTVLALLLVPVVALYAKVFYGVERACVRIPWPRPVVVALGGLLTGVVGVAAYQSLGDERVLAVMSYGYGVLQDSLDGDLVGWAGVGLLLVVAVLKIFTTSLTISSGGSGGVFGPSMVIGGCVGGAVGLAFRQFGFELNPACFVVVGMAGLFAGAASTPISTIIMVSEMTGSYELLLPSMWVCGITFLLCGRFTIYEKQVPNRAFSNAHRGEFLVPLLQKLQVSDVLELERNVTTVAVSTPLAEVIRLITRTHDDYFPVLDAEGRFVGIFSAHDVREFTFDDSLPQITIAADVMTTDPIFVTPEMDLHTAMSRFNLKNLDELPVVEAEDPMKLIGMLRRRALTRAYNERLEELKELQHQER